MSTCLTLTLFFVSVYSRFIRTSQNKGLVKHVENPRFVRDLTYISHQYFLSNLRPGVGSMPVDPRTQHLEAARAAEVRKQWDANPQTQIFQLHMTSSAFLVNNLTRWREVSLEKSIIAQFFKKFPAFMRQKFDSHFHKTYNLNRIKPVESCVNQGILFIEVSYFLPTIVPPRQSPFMRFWNYKCFINNGVYHELNMFIRLAKEAPDMFW